tara:strand:+ start:478 stop:687 length:210 start_codon:yes stop_codon:yes gene_type:complete
MNLDLNQSLQKNKGLLVLLVSENKQRKLNEAFNEIGTCNKAITIRRIAMKEGLLFNESLFLEENLFREV